MVSFYFFGLLLCVLAIPSQAHYSSCGTNETIGEITKVEISECDANAPGRCTIKRNTQGTLNLSFSTKDIDIASVSAAVHGIVFDVPVPFPLPNSNGCKDSGLQCPLAKKKIFTYTSTLPIEKKYPRVFVDVKWELFSDNPDGSKTQIVCILIPVKVI